jgi:hypothetical protein
LDRFLELRIMRVEQLRYNTRDHQWFGLVNDLYPGQAVELTLEGDQEGLTSKMTRVRALAADAAAIVERLHGLAYRKYQGTAWAKPLAEIRAMYFLSAVTLKSDNTTWWLVLEPEFNLETIYNQFLRFTMVNREIVWANFAHDTTA